MNGTHRARAEEDDGSEDEEAFSYPTPVEAFDDDPPPRGYDAELESVLDSPTKSTASVNEDDFVYHGKDAVPEEEDEEADQSYGDRMRELSMSPTPSQSSTTGKWDGEPPRREAMNGLSLGRPFSRPNAHASTSTPSAITPSQSQHSQDAFPAGQLTPSRSFTDSLASAAFPRRPVGHPISRLRSLQSPHLNRLASSSTTHSALDVRRGIEGDLPPDLVSRRSSASNLLDAFPLQQSEGGLSTPGPTSSVGNGHAPSDTFKWTPLRKVSARLYPPNTKAGVGFTPIGAASAGLMGTPTVSAVSGVVAVGTSKGWTMVFDFGQNLRCVCGTEAIAKEAGAVSALAISQDHTFIAVGHASGSIHLYSLQKPTQPARSVPPTTLQLVLTGRKEGHLIGSKILQLGFVGARHTAIVSSDETGLAFYHSLGKVLMLASTDIIRMLGRYPDQAPPQSSISSSKPHSALSSAAPNGHASSSRPSAAAASKKPSTILAMAPLPLGPSPHPSDSHNLVALLTPTKLVIVGLKPTARTWWRATPPLSSTPSSSKESKKSDVEYSRQGTLAWFPSVEGEGAKDPTLAFSWGREVKVVRVSREAGKPAENGDTAAPRTGIAFVEEKGWQCDYPVLAMQWYNHRILFIMTTQHINVYDVQSAQRLGLDAHDLSSVVSHSYYSSAFRPEEEVLSYSGSFKTHKQKLFILTNSDLRAGAMLSWADRILGLMQPSTILDAINVTTDYLLGQTDASTISLPSDPVDRRAVVEPKLREILNASLDFVFSDDRLRDGSHSDGLVIQRLFEGLVGTCVRACLAIDDVDWLFDELYERYEQNGIEGIFLARIEPYVLSGSVHALPPSVSQRLIAIHEDRGEYEDAQRIIWHVDPEFIDINQALGLCQRQKLYDALIYVYTRSMHDYVAPIVELLVLVRQIQRHRKQRPRWVGTGDEVDEEPGHRRAGEDAVVEASVPDAFKVYSYLSQALAGLSYPSKEPLSYEEGLRARTAIYRFVFSGSTRVWPERGGKAVLTSDEDGGEEPPYPYLRLLLHFDSEAMLDALDLAFEESYLEDDIPGAPVTRQSIVDLLLEIMMDPTSDDFSPVDCTFLRIFVARNLPKYPQYIQLPPSTIQKILVGLASDSDQSTTEDRQLAAEYLLSVYTPPDIDIIVSLFERADFFRLLRSIYRGERRWAALASTYLRDPDVGADLFGFLRETLELASRAGDVQRQELVATILEAVPSLIEAHEGGLQETADLVDTFLPTEHRVVIDRLSSSQWRQFAYLRCLLEPAWSDPVHVVSAAKDRTPSIRLGTPERLQYLRLLCTHEPSHVIRFLESDSQGIALLPETLEICEETEVFDAMVWAIDRNGDTTAAMDKADDTLGSRTDLLVQALLGGPEEENRLEDVDEEEDDNDGRRRGTFGATSGADAMVAQISAISKVAISICVAHGKQGRKNGNVSGEELWFRLLSSLVSTVRSVRAIAPAPARPSDRSSSLRRISGASIIHHDDPKQLSPRSSDALSSLIPTALSSLVGATSTRDVSFPKLMRRLIDSNARSPAADRSYSEFKAIVTSMLDTYVFEGDLLAITSKISAQDLFEHVDSLQRQRNRGWRAQGELCDECGQPVWGPEGSMSPPMSRSASAHMVVETMGMGGRPRMKKRPSLKGKEVEWPELVNEERAPAPMVIPPRGIVVGRDGRLWHERCQLETATYN